MSTEDLPPTFPGSPPGPPPPPRPALRFLSWLVLAFWLGGAAHLTVAGRWVTLGEDVLLLGAMAGAVYVLHRFARPVRRALRSWAASVLDQLLQPAAWLPGLFLVGSISYTAWANWWL